MREFVAYLFGLGLVANALLLVPQALAIRRSRQARGVSLATFGGFNVMQVVGVIHGYLERDWPLTIGMGASLATCGTVTLLAINYRRPSAGVTAMESRDVEIMS